MRKKNQWGEPCTCGEELIEPHTCPYQLEIHDDETLCTCCASCEAQCVGET